MDISMEIDPQAGVLGHIVERVVTYDDFYREVSRVAVCSCGASCALTTSGTMLGLQSTADNLADIRLEHYINVLAVGLEYGVDAVRWPPPKPVLQSGVLSRDSHPPDHNFEADDDFDFPVPGAPIPRRQYPPGTVG